MTKYTVELICESVRSYFKMALGSEMFVVEEFMLWLEEVLLIFWIDFCDSFIKNGELCGMCVRLSILMRLERRT